MKTLDLQGMTNMELVRGGTGEWYWSTDYVHVDLYEAEEQLVGRIRWYRP